MGKNLIIKGADFSANAIEREYYIPQAVINPSGNSFLTYSSSKNWTLEDDANELSGKTITGFDLLFVNKCGGQTMGTTITFNPGTEQEVECNVVCDFETQDESEQKIIKYDLLEPYTFKENDVLKVTITNAKYVDGSKTRGGCNVFRTERPDNIPNSAFLATMGTDSFPQFSYQPFMKLYLN